jgi:hypothetical protein
MANDTALMVLLVSGQRALRSGIRMTSYTALMVLLVSGQMVISGGI